jgi:GNAT superfamily N-acetyltransferase
MQVTEVNTSTDRKEFLNFPKRLYKDDPFWVCPLDSGVESIFDSKGNRTFGHGVANRWILKDSKGITIGRIAAFIDQIRSAANNQPTGGLGFFEVVDETEASVILFDTAIEWLKERGVEAIDGPINFGENDNNWGLLVDGFMTPTYNMPYNKKYYRSLFEQYGFKNYFEQYSYHREIRGPGNTIVEFPERIMKIAGWLSKRPGYSFRHFEIKYKQKFVKDVVEIYNSAWSAFKEDFTPLDPEFLIESLNKAKAIIDEELIWFAYYNDKPISFFILFPDLNQILKSFNGRLNLWNYIQFAYFRLTHKMTRMRAVAGGVHPSHQNSGVESAIFYHLYGVFKKKPWLKELELSWVGDYNSKMIAIYEALGTKKAKTHITYRYFINKSHKFKRFKDEMAEKHILKQGQSYNN